MKSFTDQFISDLYGSILHVEGTALSGLDVVYDGLGTASSLSVGLEGQGAKITGSLTSGNIVYPVHPSLINFIDYIYPVGSVLFSYNNTDPATRFIGTTWTQEAKGRFIVGAGIGTDGVTSRTYTVGDDNIGEYKHKLTIAEMPSHNHSFDNFGYRADRDNDENKGYWDTGGTLFTNFTGGDQAHENTPPAFGLYVWRRTA